MQTIQSGEPADSLNAGVFSLRKDVVYLTVLFAAI